jgi:LacI family transcriptional regulator
MSRQETLYPIRLVDVANAVGVSIGTASKALNGKGTLRPETRAKVIAAADRLGFHPNALARSLIRGRSFTVGLISSDIVGRFAIPVLLGAEDALSMGRIAVLFCDGRGDPVREEHYLRSLLSRRVDGIIVAGGQDDPRPPLGGHITVPVVYAWTPSANPGDCSIAPDDEGGAYMAVHHLVVTGRASIGHITGPPRFRAVQLRADGMKRALCESSAALAGGEVLYGDWSEAWGRQAIAALVRNCAELDAVFCGNDLIARGVADGLLALGRRIPDDIALMGFDNWEVMSANSRVPVSSVDLSLHKVGRLAGERLLAAIDGGASKDSQLVECSLVLRESTGMRVGPKTLPH